MNALSDTHTGGAIMWFGGDAIMAVVMIALVIGWLRRRRRRRGPTAGLVGAGAPLPTLWRGASTGASGRRTAGRMAGSAPARRRRRGARASYNEWLAHLRLTEGDRADAGHRPRQSDEV